MKHPASRDVFGYWNKQRGTRSMPDRSEIDPGAIRHALGDTFILACNRRADHPFRIAGTRLCALFCRELKGEAFVALWDLADRRMLRELAVGVIEEATATVASVRASTADGATIDLELLLLPLRHRGNLDARLLGVLAPVQIPYWLGVRPVTRLSVGVMRHLGGGVDAFVPRLLTGAQADEPAHGFTVYEGGRAAS